MCLSLPQSHFSFVPCSVQLCRCAAVSLDDSVYLPDTRATCTIYNVTHDLSRVFVFSPQCSPSRTHTHDAHPPTHTNTHTHLTNTHVPIHIYVHVLSIYCNQLRTFNTCLSLHLPHLLTGTSPHTVVNFACLWYTETNLNAHCRSRIRVQTFLNVCLLQELVPSPSPEER